MQPGLVLFWDWRNIEKRQAEQVGWANMKNTGSSSSQAPCRSIARSMAILDQETLINCPPAMQNRSNIMQTSRNTMASLVSTVALMATDPLQGAWNVEYFSGFSCTCNFYLEFWHCWIPCSRWKHIPFEAHSTSELAPRAAQHWWDFLLLVYFRLNNEPIFTARTRKLLVREGILEESGRGASNCISHDSSYL